MKDSEADARKIGVLQADEALLAKLGYKQEFKREFTSLEVGPAFPCSSSSASTVLIP
jgi:hypothetical protein